MDRYKNLILLKKYCEVRATKRLRQRLPKASGRSHAQSTIYFGEEPKKN